MDDNKEEEKETFCDGSNVPDEESVAIADPEKRSRKSNAHLFETLLIVTGPVIMVSVVFVYNYTDFRFHCLYKKCLQYNEPW